MSSTSRWIVPTGWLLVCGAIVLSGYALFPFMSDTRRVLSDTQSRGYDERLSDVRSERAPWLLDQKGGRWGRYGWYLSTGEEGSLRAALPGMQPGILKLRLWAFSPGHVSAFIRDGEHSLETLLPDVDGKVFQLTVNGPTELTIAASSRLTQEQLVLDRFASAWFPSESQLPSLLPFAVAMMLGCVGSGLWVHRRYGCFTNWSVWLGCVGILVAASVGFAYRWALFDIARGLPAEPDVVGYMAYARSLEWFTSDFGFYSGHFQEREPAHIAALNLWFRIWGDTFPATMWYTVCLSTLLIVASGAFLWGVTGQWLFGLFAAWFVALSPAWVDEAVRGLRLESMSLMLLAVLGTWVWARGWHGAVLLGVLTGLMALVQSPALGIVLPLIWLGWLLNVCRERYGLPPLRPHQWRWSHLGIVSLVAVLMFSPHLYGLYKVHGDPSWPSDGYARWNANMEFQDRLGTVGFPSVEEFGKNSYAGPRITYGEYLFGMHSIPTLLYGHLKGWVESSVYMSVSHTPDLKGLVFLHQASGFPAVLRHVNAVTSVVFLVSLFLTALGWADLWRRPQYWWVPFLSLWGTWYTAYLYSVRVIEPFRHTAHVYPLLLFCLLWGGLQVSQRLRAFMFDDAWPLWASRLSKAETERSVRHLESENPRP
jgi:hypothetical protein